MRPRVYRAYGLRLRSPWPLSCPEEPAAARADVELFDASASLLPDGQPGIGPPAAGADWFHYRRLPDGSDYLRWSACFEFVIFADGRRIACHALAAVSREVFHTYLLGQVLSFALIRRRLEPLHATAVVVDGATVAFLGDCGRGKSTLGAAFIQAGHPLVTDDLLVVRERAAGFVTYPGIPRIKLFPRVARPLLGEPAGGIPMNRFTAKLVLPLKGDQWAFRHRALPLRALYVLAPPSAGARTREISIRPLSTRRAFVELIRNTFNTMVVEPARLERQFALAARIASTMPVKRLVFPRRLGCLPSVRQAIRDDLAA